MKSEKKYTYQCDFYKKNHFKLSISKTFKIHDCFLDKKFGSKSFSPIFALL